MSTTDDELIQRLRAELDELVAGASDVSGDPPGTQRSGGSESGHHNRRWVAIGIAAASVAVLVGGLAVVADRDAGGASSDTAAATAPVTTAPPPAAPTVPATAAPGTDAVTAPPTAPPTSAPPGVGPAALAQYETIAPVLDTTEHVPALCLGPSIIGGGMPNTCVGPVLEGWSWDLVDDERSTSDATWADAYVAGTFDPATQVFTVVEARTPTGADRARFGASTPTEDLSVPCPEPVGGWPARNQEWPEEQIHMIPGYAGSWEDPTHQVVTAKFTGDMEAAEAAVRLYYGDALCVVPAHHSKDELVAIENRLMSMSSIQFMWSALYADATGEWLELGVITADPDRQAAFDEQYGPGVVRLTPQLRPL